MRLHFEDSGQGEPVIILHGLFGSSDNWRAISARLSARFRVLAVDQRNHGCSPHSDEMSYRLMAADLRELIQDAGLGRVRVLGHSMGGKTAMQLALLYPELVSALVVADIAPHLYPPRHAGIIRGMLALELNRFQTRDQIETALAPAVPELATRRFLLKNVMRTELDGFAWRIGLREISRNHDRLSEAVGEGTVFEKPTLFLRGERSDFLLEADFGEIRRLFPAARMRTLPGAGHLLHINQPDLFVRALEEFFAEQARPQGGGSPG